MAIIETPDLSEDGAKRLAQVFLSVDWLIPAYLPLGFLSRIAGAIEQASPENKLNIFGSVMSLVYSPEYVARMYTERYSKAPYVRDFSRHIDEAFKAHFSGYRLISITAMIPVIEGIIRKLATASGRDVGNGTRGLVQEFDELVAEEEKSPYRYNERLIMFKLFRDFMKSKFLAQTSRYDGIHQFNRHGILHGVFEDYGEEMNFLRIITIMDLLCLIIGYRGASISIFGPEPTDASAALATEYKLLLFFSGKQPTHIPTWVMNLFI